MRRRTRVTITMLSCSRRRQVERTKEIKSSGSLMCIQGLVADTTTLLTSSIPCYHTTTHHLKLVDLIRTIPQILQHPRQLALVRGTLLRPTHGLIQPGGPTYEDLDILLLRLRQHRLEQFLRDVAFALHPALGRVVEDVEGAEAIRVGVLEVLELGFEEDVGFGEVAEDEGDAGFVGGVFEDGAGELVHSVFHIRAWLVMMMYIFELDHSLEE